MPDTSSQELLASLSESPEDADLRERAAHALAAEGQPAQAVEVLGALVNLTAHDKKKNPLPCLCKKCLEPAAATATAKGMAFQREFAVHEGRVLFFWMPQEIAADQEAVRRAVQVKLRGRLA